MGRHKEFAVTDVLERAMNLFWERGFAEAGITDLVKATGVNRSGLYGEFKSKEELFVACLKHYFERTAALSILSSKPLGLHNIRRFLATANSTVPGQAGCFATNTLREIPILPEEAKDIIFAAKKVLETAISWNIIVEDEDQNVALYGAMTMSFFMGLAIEQNAVTSLDALDAKIETFMGMLASCLGLEPPRGNLRP